MGPNLTDWSFHKKRPGRSLTQRDEHVRHRGKTVSTRQGARPQRKSTLLTPWPQTSHLQGCEDISFCCLSCLLFGLCMAALANYFPFSFMYLKGTFSTISRIIQKGQSDSVSSPELQVQENVMWKHLLPDIGFSFQMNEFCSISENIMT